MIGNQIAHFRLLAKVGEGGMGIVYRAEDLDLGRIVALKVLPPHLVGDQDRRSRFVAEARTAASVTHQGIYAVGLGIAAYGLADLTFGNGLIAAFVTGIALGATEHEIPDRFHDFAENVSSIFQVMTFFVFGALIVAIDYDGSIPALIAFILLALLVARPVALFLSLVGTDFKRPERAFMAWFGPKGVASMLFALIVLESSVAHDSLIFKVAAYVILCSIVAHGLTDTVGARWIERHVGVADDGDLSDEIPGRL